MIEAVDAPPLNDAVLTVDEGRYALTLYVSGASELSVRAIAIAKRLCDDHLDDRYELSVVDVHEEDAVLDSEVLASPTLIKHRPLPQRKHVGDLSDTKKVLEALGIASAQDASRMHG
jgi:circadian clock protein KaiB